MALFKIKEQQNITNNPNLFQVFILITFSLRTSLLLSQKRKCKEYPKFPLC